MNINLVFHYRLYIITVICITAVVSKARETIFCTCSFVQRARARTHTHTNINRQAYREVLYH